MMNMALVLPLIIPLLSAIIAIIAWNSRTAQRQLTLVATAAHLAAGSWLLLTVWRDGIQVSNIGNWPAPFGISLVADLFSALMVTIAGFMAFLVAVYSLVAMDARREAFGYYPLFNVLLLGVCGAFLTGDVFNLFVWYEVMLIASFALLALGGERAQLEGALKYVTLNLLSSTLFLAAVGILYGLTGMLNMADLAVQLQQGESVPPGLVTTLAMLFLVSFGVKSALFPLFFWLPAAYHTPPIPVTTIFSALVSKVGVYSLVRVFTLLFVQDVNYTHTILLVLAALTMITGVLGAVAQSEVRRLLSFHIISQIGYLVMGLGLFTVLSLTGTIFFMIHVILAKSALFLVAGVVYHISRTYQLKELGGLYAAYPGVAALFLVPALALAGIPPLSGFWAKLSLVRAALESGQYLMVAVALAVSILTLFSMTKIWSEAYWKPASPAGEAVLVTARATIPRQTWLLLLAPAAVLGLLTVLMGLAAEPVLVFATRAAEQLIDPALYIQAVLGGAS
jgi:multicomponent Na+:H+ antiporter subunit D